MLYVENSNLFPGGIFDMKPNNGKLPSSLSPVLMSVLYYGNSTELRATNLSRVLVNQGLCCEKRMMKTCSLYLFKSRDSSKIRFYYRISVNLGFGYDIQIVEWLSI